MSHLNADQFNFFLRENFICDMCGCVSENVCCLHFNLQRKDFFTVKNQLAIKYSHFLGLSVKQLWGLWFVFNKNKAIFKSVHD